MFTKLFAFLSCLGVISINAPIMVEKTIVYNDENAIIHRNFQHDEYLNSYTKVTYKYETNELTTSDESGNRYFNGIVSQHSYLLSYDFLESADQLVFLNLLLDNDTTIYFPILYNSYVFDDLHIKKVDNFTYDYCAFNLNYNSGAQNQSLVAGDDDIDQNEFNISVNDLDGDYRLYFIITFDFVVDVPYISIDYINDYNISFGILPNEYNEIESVTYIQPTTIIGVINEFCETYLFSEIPLAQQMTFTIGGQQVNLMTWLIIIVGIVLSAGLLVLLFCFFKWLFLLFVGIFKR